MAKQLNVLYGFSSEKIEKSITKEIILRGFNVNSTMRTTKGLIKDYLTAHPETNVVVLKEYLDGGGVYSPLELSELVDNTRNVNVVIVLATSHRGKHEMREIYSAGILNAFFSDGKFGANPDKIADLATKGRTRKEAREYYRITEAVPDYVNLTYEEYRDYYKYLVDNSQGLNIVNRFVNISHMLYPGQMGAFIDKLPDKVKEILMKYREFYAISDKVYRMGYSRQRYKAPKGVKVVEGITKDGVNKELASEMRSAPEVFEPVLVPVSAEDTHMTPKEEVEYDEPLGLERVDENEEKAEAEEEKVGRAEEEKKEVGKPAKKGLFGRKKNTEDSGEAAEPKKKAPKKAKKQKQKKNQEESIFEQESEFDFTAESVGGEPIDENDMGWGGEADDGFIPDYEQEPAREDSENVREIEPIEQMEDVEGDIDAPVDYASDDAQGEYEADDEEVVADDYSFEDTVGGERYKDGFEDAAGNEDVETADEYSEQDEQYEEEAEFVDAQSEDVVDMETAKIPSASSSDLGSLSVEELKAMLGE